MDKVKLKVIENIVELIDVNLSGAAGKRIFEGLNFSLPRGKSAIIQGQTGAGKTSLTEVLIGIKRPDSGMVAVFGTDIYRSRESRLNRVRRNIGGVGGIFQPIAYQTVIENLSYPLILRGDRSSKRKTKIMEVLGQLSLLHKKDEQAFNISRGEQILLLLGRAIVADQPLILIDEPLAGLDPEMSDIVLEKLNRLSVAGHSLIVMTAGQTGIQLTDAAEYKMSDGGMQ